MWRALLLSLWLAAVAQADVTGPPISPPLPLSTCGPSLVGGAFTVYLSPGSCLDPAESAVALPMQVATTFNRLSCWLSGSTGSATVTLTGRAGTCGTLADTSFTCVMGPGTSTCASGATAVLALTAGQCFAFKLAVTGASLPGARSLGCTMERAR